MLELTLPYPPSVNHYWRHVGPRVLISRAGRAYREAIIAVAMRPGRQPMRGAIEIEIELSPPDRRRRDLDNTLKAVLDALAHAGVYEDDSQICKITIGRAAVIANGRAVVRIEERGKQWQP